MPLDRIGPSGSISGPMARRIFITVAEVSGDQHAAHLIHSLRQLDPSLIIEGHGGPAMEAAGAIIHHEMTHKAAMSFHALKRVGEIWNLLAWTGRYYDRSKPHLHICIDSPDSNLPFARIAHQRGVPVLYYIAPQLWAWREGRIKKVRQRVDQVACILPFEEAYFRQHGVKATFVGHPLFDRLPRGRGPALGVRFPNRPPVVGLLPGSRRSEAMHNYHNLLEVAERIRGQFPQARFLVPTTPGTHPIVEQLSKGHDSIDYGLDRFDEMVPQCDLCLTVSGTATLHVAAYGIPMIVVYRSSPLSWHLLGRWLIKTRTYSLVNLLNSRNHIVPEFIPWYGSNEPVAERAIDYLKHPEKLADQAAKLTELVRSLDHPGASMNVAKLAMQMMGGQQA